MKARTMLLLTVVLLIVLPIAMSEDGSAATKSNVKITEVSPSDEAFTLENRGTSVVDLKGYSVTDGEGTLVFSSAYRLSPGSSVTISKEKGTDWFNSRNGVLVFTSSYLTKSGSFVLANAGDEVSLIYNGTVVDSVCYGTSSGVGGWTGEPVQISSGHYLLRTSSSDSDTRSDWISTKAGWTNLDYGSASGFDAVVYPFSFPEDCGKPVLSKLSEARNTVDISIYLLSSPEVVSLLCQLEKRGVEVRVLLEGSPLGVDISTELSLMKSLVDSGGEVRIINYSGSTEHRYSYVHNKYAIIDGGSVILTSENWTQGNIGDYGNRGWGVVIECRGYADYLKAVFENDFSMEWGDVKGLTDLYPRCKSYGALPEPYTGYGFGEGIKAVVHSVMSPDNSFVTLKEFIGSGNSRVYAEQMDLGSSLSSVTGNTPVTWLSDASTRGLDVKFILDSSQSNGSTHESYVNLIVNACSVKAITVNGGDGFSLIHNKGVIVDDRVWVGSVNWTENSFNRNRESAVIIDSPQVAGYFAKLFVKDFGSNEFTVEEYGLALQVSVVETSCGNMVLMVADGPADASYEWDLGDGTVRVSGTNRVLFPAPSEGSYTASVRMQDTDALSTCGYQVVPNNTSGGYSVSDYALISAVSVLVLGVTISLLRSRRDNKPERTSRNPGYRAYR